MKNIIKLLKNIRINEYAIRLEEEKQLSFDLIYNLKLIKLKILKTYIKTNLANSFIWPFKSFTRVLIFFDKKLDRSLCFYINY